MNPGLYPNPAGNSIASATVFVAGYYEKDTVVISPVSYQFYLKKVSGSSTADPSSDSANWGILGAPARKSYQEGDITLLAGSNTGTATITAVTGKYILRYLGTRTAAIVGSDVGIPWVALEYTNTTTITARRSSSGVEAVVRYSIEDFW